MEEILVVIIMILDVQIRKWWLGEVKFFLQLPWLFDVEVVNLDREQHILRSFNATALLWLAVPGDTLWATVDGIFVLQRKSDSSLS